jgi:predicted  nucleic acid-binding Zn-ribbon protein
VSSAWLSAAIQEFDQVTLDNGTELFRIRARAQRGDDPEPRPVLVTRGQDGTVHIYEPLSSGGDRRGMMRLAYTVPSDRLGPSTAFSLRLPDGYWIELPEPTPGENRAESADGERWPDAEAGSEYQPSPNPDDAAALRIAELEQQLSELRSSDDERQQRLAELTAEQQSAGMAALEAQQALEALRGSHGVVEQELRSTRESLAHALSELELAHAERDAALDAAREDRGEHARLTGRLRQLQARIELQRADATGSESGSDPRLRRLESEREQLTVHVRALAELLSTDESAGDADGLEALGDVVAGGPADGLETLRARALQEANESAEHELQRMRAGTAP